MTQPPIFTFVDLFAGIGGMRLGFESAGGKCVYSVEWDKYARRSYAANFDEPEGCDIRDVQRLTEHDVLLAGFPCQPFSIAGVTKKASLGRPHGFTDQTQGTLFFEIARMLRVSQPPVFVLENVKNLLRHDKGRTFEIIKRSLDELGYKVTHRVIDSRPWVPQKRERVFVIGLHRDVYPDQRFEFPEQPDAANGPVMASILEDAVPTKYNKSQHVWSYLKAYQAKHAKAGNGFGYGLVGPEDVARTLSARYYKDGSEILVRNRDGAPPRMLTPRECARMMGFGEEFKIEVSDTQAYKQFGNSVVVPVVSWIAQALVEQAILPPPHGRENLEITREDGEPEYVDELDLVASPAVPAAPPEGAQAALWTMSVWAK